VADFLARLHHLLRLMKLDVANYHVRALRPHIQAVCVMATSPTEHLFRTARSTMRAPEVSAAAGEPAHHPRPHQVRARHLELPQSCFSGLGWRRVWPRSRKMQQQLSKVYHSSPKALFDCPRAFVQRLCSRDGAAACGGRSDSAGRHPARNTHGSFNRSFWLSYDRILARLSSAGSSQRAPSCVSPCCDVPYACPECRPIP
jgi:hypothetical protein